MNKFIRNYLWLW